MNNVTIHNLLEMNSIEYKVFLMMEKALIVGETFANLFNSKKIDENLLHKNGDSSVDVYEKLIDIALEIQKEDEPGDTPYEDMKTKANELIIQEYGKKENKTYLVIETENVTHHTFDDHAYVIGVFNKRYEAEDMVDKENSERRWIIEQ